MKDLVSTELLAGNSVGQFLLLFIVILISLVLWRILAYLLTRNAEKYARLNKNLLSITLQSLARTGLLVVLTLALRGGFSFLTLSDQIHSFLRTLTSLLLVLSIGKVLYALFDVVDRRLEDLAESTKSPMNEMFATVIGKSLRITLIILILLQITTILIDKPITSVLATLGVGGLAVALASQDTIRNFFGSLVLVGDKPFQVGERVVIDGHDGPVETVGLRSTRIRTLDGHLITIPNGELANKTIQNIGRRPYIRRKLNMTITYDTSPEKVQKAVDIIKEILKDHEGQNPDFPPRVYFNDFNSDSLNIIVIYWYHPPNYWDFMIYNERVNFEILERFNAEGIDFAFPTQTHYIAGDSKRPFNIHVVES